MSTYTLITISFVLLLTGGSTLRATELKGFPDINQREIPGATYRCGSITLATWLIWLSENGYPSLLPHHVVETATHPFNKASLKESDRKVLITFDQYCRGNRDIRLVRLVEALVAYFHAHTDSSLKLTVAYYNLPGTSLLKELYDSGGYVTLLHGIYTERAGELIRVDGHYTNLIGYRDSHLKAHTFGEPYQFKLNTLPMNQLRAKDRYAPKGNTSYVYMRYPESEYPRYTYQSFSPADREHALRQTNRIVLPYSEASQSVLLEGALVFWIHEVETE